MREILFRGKSTNSGKWAEGSLIYRYKYYGDPDDSYFILLDGEFDYDYYDAEIVDKSTVGQYTGLTDKNGKRIFEGDIVVIGGERNYPAYICFETSSFVCKLPEHIYYKHRLENNLYKYEVIGNIYDNPELLKISEVIDDAKIH